MLRMAIPSVVIKLLHSKTDRLTDNYFNNCSKVKFKGKAIPVQAWTSPDGSRRVRLPDFKNIET